MSAPGKFEAGQTSGRVVSILDRILGLASRHNATLLLVLVMGAVAVVGLFVIRDLQTANAEAQNMYAVSVHGLRQIGELQYDAQETRRATLYALSTNDSNLQVEYADQSRAADQSVTEGIAEYGRQAKLPAENELADQLRRDWANYLSVRDEVLASILEGSAREAVALDLSGGVPSFERVRKDLNEVKRLYDEQASQRLANVMATSHRSAVRLIGILGFTFLLSSAAVWAIQRSRMLSAIQLAKLQMEFVASVSHELRTPLAVLSSAADNIADGLIEGKAGLQKYGAVIQNQSRQMSGLVDQILLFASTEDRKSRYFLQPLQVSQIIEAVVASTRELIQGANFVLERHIEPGLPQVMGDLSAVSQCLQNLIGNAVKYGGDSRWIGLRASAGPFENGVGQEIRISVSDRGIGIDRSELPNIFDPFYRSPRVNAMQIHGTGLGLSLANRIAETMGGRLSVISELSVGSTFTLHLPIAEGERLETAATASEPGSSILP
jgi:signal transduction histidine kinase